MFTSKIHDVSLFSLSATYADNWQTFFTKLKTKGQSNNKITSIKEHQHKLNRKQRRAKRSSKNCTNNQSTHKGRKTEARQPPHDAARPSTIPLIHHYRPQHRTGFTRHSSKVQGCPKKKIILSSVLLISTRRLST